MSKRINVLIVVGEVVYPLRASIRDLIYSFKHDNSCNAFYYFSEQGPFPEYLKKVSFDLVVFTDSLACERWKGKELFNKYVVQPLSYLKNIDALKIINAQDEWIYTNILNEFINDFNITYIYSVAPETEWKKIYDKVDYNKVKFHKVLTGYLEEGTVKKIDAITNSINVPEIDVGYRAFKAPPWLGSHGYLKTKIADVFSERAPKAGFKTDISTNEKDTISGDNWFRFMANCKYFIGVEGGSTVIDRNGDIFKKGLAYEKAHPKADFAEFEKNCFPGMDGNLNLIAISPRHLEACAAKTCQVLIEGSYNDILIPGKHFIELKKDFSNLDEVFNKMKDENLRISMINAAYKDIVASGKYSYKEYTNYIIETSLNGVLPKRKPAFLNRLCLMRNRLSEKRFWKMKRSH